MLEGIEDDVDEIQREQVARQRTTCRVAQLYAELDDVDRERLLRIVEGRAWASTIEQGLAKRGIQISRNSIERHRRRGKRNGCACQT